MPARWRAQPRLEALRAAVNQGHSLREAMEDANEAVFTKSLTDEELGGMGTTVTAATLAAGNTLLVGHVGDSRLSLRDGELRQITTDHSRVQELVDDGRLTADEAAVHPMRNIVTRAVGVDPSVDVDVYPVELQPAIECCSARTVSPTCCTTTSSVTSCAARRIRRARRHTWSTPRTPQVAWTTSQSS